MTKTSWQDRERARFAAGKYREVPWAKHEWVAKAGPVAEHFVHVSEKDPYMLAYTPSGTDGERDRRVPIKPGRYLQKFYADRLSGEQIKEYASQIRGTGLRMEYTDDPAKAGVVYAIGGLMACMSHGTSHYQAAGYNGGHHPIEAYFGGDLQLAYAKDPGGTIIGRALVWPERKLYTRCYGDTEAMKRGLESEGYTYGLFDGARLKLYPLTTGSFPIRKLDSGVTVPYLTAPYVDHIKWARYEPDAKLFRLQVKATGATHSVQHGDGIAYPVSHAKSRPAGITGETIASEHARLVAMESGKLLPTTPLPTPQPQAGGDIGAIAAPNEAVWRHDWGVAANHILLPGQEQLQAYYNQMTIQQQQQPQPQGLTIEALQHAFDAITRNAP